jgi:hypothetical protein
MSVYELARFVSELDLQSLYQSTAYSKLNQNCGDFYWTAWNAPYQF